jgi:hypothetical protein
MNNEAQYILYLIVTAIMVTGCSITPSATTPVALTNITHSLSTEEFLPTIILTATQLPNLSPPPTPVYPRLITPHVTTFPTRTDAETKEELEYMLRTNGDCRFPCFWGIYPEQTRYEDIYAVIDNLGGYRFENLQEDGDVRVGTNFRFQERNGIFVEFQANLQDDVVKDLKVLLLNLRDTGITLEDWSAYTLDKILQTYGIPDSVELYFSRPYNALSFNVQLKYENIDTSIAYYAGTSEITKYETTTSVLYCPEEIGIDIVELHMGKNPFNTIPDGVSILKATGLNEQDFHKLFTENPSACLTLNREAMQ